jgi:hypothetical protein
MGYKCYNLKRIEVKFSQHTTGSLFAGDINKIIILDPSIQMAAAANHETFHDSKFIVPARHKSPFQPSSKNYVEIERGYVTSLTGIAAKLSQLPGINVLRFSFCRNAHHYQERCNQLPAQKPLSFSL